MAEPLEPLTLLDPVPFARVDHAELTQLLSFAFATGDVGDAFERLLDTMPLAPSTWHPEEFAEDIFLRRVVDKCLPLRAGGSLHEPHPSWMLRLLGHPPADPNATRFRQQILSELAEDPPLRAAFEAFYVDVSTLRSLLSRSGVGAQVDAFQRRLEVLRRIESSVVRAAEFERAKSGLVRLGAWARRLLVAPAFERLRQLLEYENAATEVDVRLQLGFDGQVRGFAVLARRPNRDNVFYQRPVARWYTRLGLFLRGERFSEQELLARLLDDIFEGIQGELVPLFPLLGDLEFYLMGLGFHDACRAAKLPISLPTFTGQRRLRQLFNPLLWAERGAATPCDLGPLASDALVVVTGPNSGGKTRLLQALALTQAFGQAGLYVPAAAAELPWTEALFVSLLEHARADQAEGRLGTELTRIRRMFEHLRDGSMVLVDELCSGTNPAEGEQIFRLVVKLLRELRPSAFITTHFLAVAARLAQEHRDLDFLQVELDANLEPTYRFVPGVATTSLAERTAARLGVTEDALRSLVRRSEPGASTRIVEA